MSHLMEQELKWQSWQQLLEQEIKMSVLATVNGTRSSNVTLGNSYWNRKLKCQSWQQLLEQGVKMSVLATVIRTGS